MNSINKNITKNDLGKYWQHLGNTPQTLRHFSYRKMMPNSDYTNPSKTLMSIPISTNTRPKK